MIWNFTSVDIRVIGILEVHVMRITMMSLDVKSMGEKFSFRHLFLTTKSWFVFMYFYVIYSIQREKRKRRWKLPGFKRKGTANPYKYTEVIHACLPTSYPLLFSSVVVSINFEISLSECSRYSYPKWYSVRRGNCALLIH